jgi:hypothetical protein
MGGGREQPFVPYGRPISLRIHPGLLARLDHEVERLNHARPPRPVTRSSLIQQALRTLLEGPAGRAGAEVRAAPVSGVPGARRHGQANDARSVAEHEARGSRGRGLWRRFDQACDQGQVTPPDWLRRAAQRDAGFDRAALMAWYRAGELPEGEQGDRLMDLVEAWLESS